MPLLTILLFRITDSNYTPVPESGNTTPGPGNRNTDTGGTEKEAGTGPRTGFTEDWTWDTEGEDWKETREEGGRDMVTGKCAGSRGKCIREIDSGNRFGKLSVGVRIE